MEGGNIQRKSKTMLWLKKMVREDTKSMAFGTQFGIFTSSRKISAYDSSKNYFAGPPGFFCMFGLFPMDSNRRPGRGWSN